jgi:hypothetical protein
MLGDGRQDVRRREHLEVAVDLGIEARAVDHQVGHHEELIAGLVDAVFHLRPAVTRCE